MKKTFIALLGLIIIAALVGGVVGYNNGVFGLPDSNIDDEEQQALGDTDATPTDEDIEQETKTGEDLVQDKISQIRKRLALKGLIIEGDRFLSEGENTLALKKYLAFYRENPSDSLILEKLGDTYFSMHKYPSAVSYYEKQPNPSEKYILSLMYSVDFSNVAQIKDFERTIESLSISEEEKFYYLTSANCAIDFHQCKLDFGAYFDATDPVTGIKKEISYTPLANIKNAIQSYQNFQLDDVALKNAYIIGAWYGDGLLTLTSYLGEKELQERPDYRPLLKIVAQSYFKLGKYDQSRAYLSSYNSIDDSDPAIAYMLGVVNTQLGELLLANIHFERAIELGYSESILARRALIYNFYSLDNKENLLKNLQVLIDEEDYSENDASLAIYNHIAYQSYDWVEKMLPDIQKKFPESGNIYAYHGWLEREKGNGEKARGILKAGETLDPNNPFLLINIAYNEKDLGNKGAALVYFKKTVSVGEGSEFAQQAKIEIEQL